MVIYFALVAAGMLFAFFLQLCISALWLSPLVSSTMPTAWGAVCPVSPAFQSAKNCNDVSLNSCRIFPEVQRTNHVFSRLGGGGVREETSRQVHLGKAAVHVTLHASFGRKESSGSQDVGWTGCEPSLCVTLISNNTSKTLVQHSDLRWCTTITRLKQKNSGSKNIGSQLLFTPSSVASIQQFW